MPNFTTPIHESNDCHTPAGSSKGGQFCADDGGGDIWRTPKKEYAAYPTDAGYSDDPASPYQTYRRNDQAWDRAAKTAIATGLLTPEDATVLAGGKHVLRPQTDRGIWEPLPPVLYHVTVNLPAVVKSGLLTKDERNSRSGEGLGGGDSAAISFTTDKAYAGLIYETFLGLHDVATGKTTAADLIQAAKDGSAGSKPFYAHFAQFVGSQLGDFEYFEKGLVHHSEFAIAASKIPAGATPAGEGWMGRDERIYHGYTVPMTPAERVTANTHAYNAWLMARQEAGGPENPWFGFNDAAALAKIPRENIAVLKAAIKPRSMGWFQSSAEREWRVPTGKVIQKLTVLKTKNRRWVNRS